MPFKVTPTDLPEVLVVEPKVFNDQRGYFYESFNAREFSRDIGPEAKFVQDNHSFSTKGVLRGLHYQIRYPQGKLVRVGAGSVFDVAVDLRRSSPRFAQWVGVVLSAENRRQLWIPPGFAHGFLVLGESADLLYKTTEYWHPEFERTLLWEDLNVGVRWPLEAGPILAPKDANGTLLADAEVFE